jgi:hypothetical protein
MRRFRFNKFGLAEDPREAHVVFDLAGRHYIVEVVGVRRNETRGCTLLQTRHMDGSEGPEVSAAFVHVLEREYAEGDGIKWI